MSPEPFRVEYEVRPIASTHRSPSAARFILVVLVSLLVGVGLGYFARAIFVRLGLSFARISHVVAVPTSAPSALRGVSVGAERSSLYPRALVGKTGLISDEDRQPTRNGWADPLDPLVRGLEGANLAPCSGEQMGLQNPSGRDRLAGGVLQFALTSVSSPRDPLSGGAIQFDPAKGALLLNSPRDAPTDLWKSHDERWESANRGVAQQAARWAHNPEVAGLVVGESTRSGPIQGSVKRSGITSPEGTLALASTEVSPTGLASIQRRQVAPMESEAPDRLVLIVFRWVLLVILALGCAFFGRETSRLRRQWLWERRKSAERGLELLKANGELVALSDVRRTVQTWLDKQGHDRCWYYPDLFREIATTLDLKPTIEPKLPSLVEFREGCRRYQAEEYGFKLTQEPNRLTLIRTCGEHDVYLVGEKQIKWSDLSFDMQTAFRRMRGELVDIVPVQVGDPRDGVPRIVATMRIGERIERRYTDGAIEVSEDGGLSFEKLMAGQESATRLERICCSGRRVCPTCGRARSLTEPRDLEGQPC